MPRGGRRSAKPGASYTNRSDLATQPVRTAPGQTYGVATQQANAQRAVPLPASPPVSASPAPTVAPAAPPEPGMLHAPTTRLNEPVTAGLPIGAGPGTEALGVLGANDDQVIANLYRAYQLAPNEGLRALIEQIERSRGIGR